MGARLSTKRQIKKDDRKKKLDKFDKAMDDIKKIGILSCCLVGIMLVVSLFIDPNESYAAVVEELPASFKSVMDPITNPDDPNYERPPMPADYAQFITGVSTPRAFYGIDSSGSRLSNIYCMDRMLLMEGGVTYNKDKSVVDESLTTKYPGLIYIIENGDTLPSELLNTVSSSDQAVLTYYVNQLAVWWYIDIVNGYSSSASDPGKNVDYDGPAAHPYLNNLSVEEKTAIINDTKYGPYIRELVTAAVNYQADTNPSLNTINTSDITFTTTDQYIETSLISVSSNSSNFINYTVNTNNNNIKVYNEAGIEQTTFNANERFKLRIPLSEVVDFKVSLNVSIVGSFSVHDAYFYVAEGETTSSLKHQRALLGLIVNDTKSVGTHLEYEIPTGKVVISKQDSVTGAGIKGAVLSITDKTGKEVYRYETTGEDVDLTLPVGSYVVTETVIPEGYQAEVTTVNFDVVSGGTTPVVLLNTPEIDVPNTGLDAGIIYGIGTLIVIAGIVLIVVALKPKNAKGK